MFHVEHLTFLKAIVNPLQVIRGKGVRRQAFQAGSGHLAQIVGSERARLRDFVMA